MSWYRTSDDRPLNKKVRPLSDAAYRLEDQAGHYCNRQRTDGLIGPADLEEITLGIKGRRVRDYIAEILRAGLWHASGAQCSSEFCPAHYMEIPPSHFARHDHFEYQPTKSEIELKQAKRRDAGRLGGIASGLKRRSKREANPEAESKQNASTLVHEVTKQNGSKIEANAKLPARASRPEPVPGTYSPPATPPPSRDAGPVLDVLRRVSGKPPSGANVRTIDDWLAEFQQATPLQLASWLEDAWSYRAQPPDKLELLTRSIRIRYASWRDDQLKARSA